MKKIKMSALVLAAASIASTGAMAQSSKANAWEGAYAQVSVGYESFMPKIGNGTISNVVVPGATFSGSTTSTSGNANGGSAALGVGYNLGINADYVLGLGVSYYPGASSGGAASFTPTLTSPMNIGTQATVNGSYDVKNLYSVFLSPGYVIDKDKLAYFKVGYTGATIGVSGATMAYQTTNLSGYNLGLGYKQMISSSIYLLGEFNYASFGTKTTSVSTTTGAIVTAPLSGNGIDFLVGVGYRF